MHVKRNPRLWAWDQNAHSAKISASYAIIEVKPHPLLSRWAGLMDMLLLSINWGFREKTPPLGTRLMRLNAVGACLGFDSAS